MSTLVRGENAELVFLSENMEELSVKDNADGNPEIVPFDGNLPDLSSDAMERGVSREKILDNDSWFEYMGEEGSEEEEEGEPEKTAEDDMMTKK